MKMSTGLRLFISEKTRLHRNWMLSRNKLDKRLINKACIDLKIMLYEHKYKTTAEFLEKINNSKYNGHLLWKSTKYLKRPTKRSTTIKILTAVGAKQIKAFQKLSLFYTSSIEEYEEVMELTMSNGFNHKILYA